VYEDMAVKFLEHYLAIAAAMIFYLVRPNCNRE